MTISYPLAFPNSLVSTATYQFSIDNADGRNPSPNTYQEQVITHGGERIRLTFSWAPLSLAQFRDIWGFIVSLDGAVGSFTWGEALEMKTPAGPATGTPLVNGVNQVGKVLITDGWTHSVTGILKRGDWIGVSGSAYWVTQDANSDSSGNCSINIWPNIRTPLGSSPGDNAPIATSNVTCTMRLDGATQSYSGGTTKLYTVGMTCTEAI